MIYVKEYERIRVMKRKSRFILLLTAAVGLLCGCESQEGNPSDIQAIVSTNANVEVNIPETEKNVSGTETDISEDKDTDPDDETDIAE